MGRRTGQQKGGPRGSPSWDAAAGSRGASRNGDGARRMRPGEPGAGLSSGLHLCPLLPGWYQHCSPFVARSPRPPRQHGAAGQGHVATNPCLVGAPGPGGKASAGQAWGAGCVPGHRAPRYGGPSSAGGGLFRSHRSRLYPAGTAKRGPASPPTASFSETGSRPSRQPRSQRQHSERPEAEATQGCPGG